MQDRFSDESPSLLGRGASAAVFAGTAVKVLGSTEVRTAVAVKEIPKRSGVGEARAMREYVVLSQRLQPQHPNLIRVLGVESASNAFFIVMELCAFSLDKAPEEFKAFLHDDAAFAATENAFAQDNGAASAGTTRDSVDMTAVGAESSPPASSPSLKQERAVSSLPSSSSGSTGGGAPAVVSVGALVLSALVQDVLRGVGFLHSKRVAHCDVKPANVLVCFDRGGSKPRGNKAK